MIIQLKVRADNPAEAAERLRSAADVWENDGRVGVGELFDPLAVLMDKEPTLISWSSDSEKQPA